MTQLQLPRDDWDVIVIGAGPSGSFAASQLADSGLRTLLVERKEFPRQKVCGGCLNARGLSVLQNAGLLPVALAAHSVVIDKLSVRSQKKTLEVAIPPGLALCRGAFDEGLARAASQRGAQLVTGVTARIVDATSLGPLACTSLKTVQLESTSDRRFVQTKVVVIAGGLDSAERCAPGLFKTVVARSSRIGVGALMESPPAAFTPNTVHMNASRGGYAGAVRLADGKLIVAAAIDPAFLREHGTVARSVRSIFQMNGWGDLSFSEKDAFRGTPSLTRSILHPAAHRVFVVGDAAGYVEPFTGEGMASALTSAQAVVSLVQKGVVAWSRSLEIEWECEYRRVILKSHKWCRVFSTLLRDPRWTRAAMSLATLWPALPNALARRIIGAPPQANIRNPIRGLPLTGDSRAVA